MINYKNGVVFGEVLQLLITSDKASDKSSTLSVANLTDIDRTFPDKASENRSSSRPLAANLTGIDPNFHSDRTSVHTCMHLYK